MGARAPTSGLRCCATTVPSGWTWCTDTALHASRRSAGHSSTTTSIRLWSSWAGGADSRPRSKAVIAGEFWNVGRLTLEAWLVPRLTPDVVNVHPGCGVVHVAASDEDVTLTLSDGAVLTADSVVFASGYKADLARVPYLTGMLDRLSVTDGFPDLTEGFETSLAGLYVTGFASTRDFGPFYGFTKGCPSSARIAIADMMR